MSSPGRLIECTIPVLRVKDLPRSVAFYTGVLGFALEWGGKEGEDLCSVARDGCALMLSEGSRGHTGAWVWIGLEDDVLFAQLREPAVRILQEPRNFPWAYETKIEDPDGNVLWLGTGPKTDRPFDRSAP